MKRLLAGMATALAVWGCHDARDAAADPTRRNIVLTAGPAAPRVAALPARLPRYGIYRRGTFAMRYTVAPGFGELSAIYGGDDDVPLIGDWDGRGSLRVGVYRPAEGTFHLSRADASDHDVDIRLGSRDSVPIVGDWDGDGDVTVGVFDPVHAVFSLLNANSSDEKPQSIRYGLPGDLPVAGDWDGDGKSTIGVFRAGTFLLRNSNAPGPPDLVLRFGLAGDVPLSTSAVGTRNDTVGVFRPSTGAFFFLDEPAQGARQQSAGFGIGGDRPILGDWTPAAYH